MGNREWVMENGQWVRLKGEKNYYQCPITNYQLAITNSQFPTIHLNITLFLCVFASLREKNSMSTQPIISVQNLNHYFGSGELRKQALFHINLEIYAGDIVIMTGPSGSGKTTLLSLMGGLRSAQEGSLKILSEEMCKANKKQLTQIRRQIGYIFQAHNLMTFLTAKENVRMSLELHDEMLNQDIDGKALAILETVGLGNRANYYPENLSGGQRQRVA